jgi:general secretion pathway protein A
MYLDFYQLREKPFPISSGLKFFFLSSSHKEALSVLAYEVSQRKGLMTVLGDFGLGKTTLIQAFLKEASQGNDKIIPLLNSTITFEELLLFLCRALGPFDETEGQSGLLYLLLRGLRRAYNAGINVVLLIDEAHNMPEETLESLRLISNLEVDFKKTIQIVFIGQPVFWEKLSHRDLRQIKQRIGVIVTLSPLTPAESREYIRLRIERAGGRVNAVFTRGALAEIVEQSGGNPWKINILSTKVLISGYEQSQKPISKKIVREVFHRLQGTKRITYFPWAISSAGVLLISLGWLTLNRLPDFSRIWESRFAHPPINQGQSGRIASGKIIEEQFFPPVPAINPSKEKESQSPFGTPASWNLVKGEAPLLPPIFSETEILKPPPRSEEKPPGTKRAPKPLGMGSNQVGDTLPVLKNPPARTIRVVKEGDNFFRMVLKVYGFSNQAVWNFVQKYNPGIKDVTRIRIGEKIVFPEWKAGEPKKG